MWLFLATEMILFGGLFLAYAYLRGRYPARTRTIETRDGGDYIVKAVENDRWAEGVKAWQGVEALRNAARDGR